MMGEGENALEHTKRNTIKSIGESPLRETIGQELVGDI